MIAKGVRILRCNGYILRHINLLEMVLKMEPAKSYLKTHTAKHRGWLKYCNRKMLVILMLGFSSGLPLSLVGGTLQAWFKYSGIDIVTIGLLGLVGQPYSYKYIWAPLMDRFSLPYLGRRRGWIITAQGFIVVATVCMAFLDPLQEPWLLAGVALLMAFFSASQDIAVDAYKVEILEPDERGLGVALGVEGYRLAMIVSSGMALILADTLGWQQTYLIMAVLVFIGIFAVLLAPEPKIIAAPTDKNFVHLVKAVFTDFFQRPQALTFLAFIICYKLGDAFSTALSTVFMLDVGFSLTAVGTINKVIGLTATLVGIFFGGVLMTRLGLFRALMLFGGLQAITNLLYIVIAISGVNYPVAASIIFIECLCAGMGTAAFVALLMSLCNPKFTATQYALLSSLMAVGRVYVGPVAGVMVKSLGWISFYFATALIALPGIALLWYLRQEIKNEGKRVWPQDQASAADYAQEPVVATQIQ